MKSSPGFWASIVFLLAVPAALICQMMSGVEAETFLHFALASGSALLCASVTNFKTPVWIRWLGFAATGSLAVIFFLQGLGQVFQNEWLSWLALQVLGQWVEGFLIDLMLIWLVGVLLADSAGRTRVLGFAAMSIAVLIKAYSYLLYYLGTSLDAAAPALKMLLLLPFVWLILESKKRI